ncbi:MAG: HAMP domain-containing sensor histidine kinase [Bacteroidales bacterium]
MTNRFYIFLSALALGVLLLAQSVFITDTYRTKREQFDARFGGLVREGMNEFNEQESPFDRDSLLYVLDRISLEYQYADPDTLKERLEETFVRILNEYREPETFLQFFLLAAGEVPLFTYHNQLRDLRLLDMDLEIPVYPTSDLLPAVPPGALRAGTYTYERNFFRVTYEVYVNFTNRSAMILSEMRRILLLSVVTLVLVFFVFFLTLRNLMTQKRLSDMKTDFINNMTHELKTPLSTISVASSSLGNRQIVSDSGKVEELSALIKKQNIHLSGLIDRILDISIWEKDQVALKVKPVELEPWIRHLVGAFLLEKGERAPEIDLDLNLQVPVLPMDEVHMSTAINNLLGNAVKYGPDRVPMRIQVHSRPEILRVRITDEGPGIPREEQKHIFEKFYRGTEAKTKVIRGLGLGLYYVKQIVEGHGGTISVESRPGEGSAFTIQIPYDHGSLACGR